MSSHLRLQTNFQPISAHTTQASFPHKTVYPPQKKQKMTITQTYRLAHSARGKLSSEASRGDHDLRLLVGHANLLDSLMLELQDAENEQEAWFNETMKNASPKSPEEPKHIQWRDEVINQHHIEVSEDERDSDSEDEEDSDDESFEVHIPLRKVRSPPPSVVSPVEYYGDDEDEESDDEYNNLDLALVRTQSHSVVEPLPELVNDNSDDSDDDSSSSSSPPTTPPQLSLNLKNPKQEAVQIQDFAMGSKSRQLMLEEDGYFIPPRQEQATLIAAY